MSVELLTIGCTGQELVDKINEIIAAVNGMSNVSSYNDLTDKPTINGVTVQGEKNTAQLQIKVSEAADYTTTVTNTLATKSEVTAAQSASTAAATAAVQTQIAGKMDKDPSSVSEVTMTSGESYVYVYGDGSLKKVKLDTLTKNVSYSIEQKETYEKVVSKDGKLIELEGEKDGENVTFTAENSFVSGTTRVYFNGQLLTLNTDYVERNSTQISLLTHIPVSTDVLLLVAVPA